MPKIPTFTTQARPTAEVGSIKSNIQIPLTQNIGTVLKPVTDAIVKHRVNEKNLENKAEALTLENESIFKLNEVFDEASKLDNKEQAFNLIQSKSKTIQDEFSNKASNKFVKSAFNNSFLSEVQKGIFKTNTRVSKNVLDTLDNQVSIRKNLILTEAYLAKNPMALQVAQTDLENLYEKTYKGRIDVDQYNELIQSIPGEMQSFEVTQAIISDPRRAFSDLMDKDKFVNLDINKRTKFIQEAKGVLIPEVRNEWKNYAAAAAVGKEIPFDTKFAKEILYPKEYNSMLEQYNVIKTTVANVSVLNSVSNNDLKTTLEGFTSKAYKEMDFIEAQKVEEYYKEIISKRNEAMSKDPVTFLNQTNDNIKILNEELSAETNPELINQKKLALTEILYQTQKTMGQPDHKIKILSENESDGFVEKYVNSDAKTRVAMLQDLDNKFGDYNSKAMLELSENELPITAELSSFLKNPTETMKFLSLDSKEKQDNLKNYLKDNESSIVAARIAVRNQLKDFENVVALGSRFDSSIAAEKLDKIVNVLSYYAANELFVGAEESLDNAAVKAAQLINGNFDIQDSYYVPYIYDGKNIRTQVTKKTGIIDKADLIQKHYVEKWNAVAFESGTDSVEEVKLTEAYKSQLKNFGQWRNTADGTGLIYGIVLSDGSFGLIKNAQGDNLTFKFDDTSKTLPGSDINLNYDLLRIPDENKNDNTP